jgi:predicted CxxxxCH...CXXCH cytochrome family protein
MTRRARPLLAAVLAIAATGCGVARQPSTGETKALIESCTRCHGDASRVASATTDPLVAVAPPRGTRGGQAPTDADVGAHQLHLSDGPGWKAVACASCHFLPSGGISHPVQAQGRLTFSGMATNAWPGKPVPQPTWSGTSCGATYCHGGFPGGNASNAPVWTSQRADACGTCHDLPPPSPHPAVASDRDGCKTCHPDPLAGDTHLDGKVEFVGHETGWVDVASPSFHAFSANRGIAGCQFCHGADLSGSFTSVACASCHDGGVHLGTTVVAFTVGGQPNCTACHGGTDNATGAPPRATWGNSGDPVRVGAHTSHLSAVPPVACESCHVKPADMFSAGHVDGPTATVTFGGLAVAGSVAPSWDRGTATCSATYCHGGTLSGGSNTSPDWTRPGQGQAACGTCHGLPPAALPSASHPAYVFNAPCMGCHPGSTDVDAGGGNVIVAGGQHLDGSVQATFTGHPTGWAVPGFNGTVGGLHTNQACMGCGPSSGITMDQYYNECTLCHGASGDFNPTGGVSRVSCGACHPAFFDGTGHTSCTFCH